MIEKIVSFNGAAIGLHGSNVAEISFDYVYEDELSEYIEKDEDTEDDRSSIQIQQLCPGHEITFALLAELMVDGVYPYPNQFYACNILLDKDENGKASVSPNPPNGIDNIWCADYVPDDPDDILPDVLPVEIKFDINMGKKTICLQQLMRVLGLCIMQIMDLDMNHQVLFILVVDMNMDLMLRMEIN